MSGPPARLGRYEILGDLAVGGMAEILLARVVGPSGFERPVVVKRILPHLARHEAFVAMFLDEARIAAAIRHHNVIHVEELQQGDEGLYLVMEYLEGESAAGLMRRLFSRDETLDLGLAAYVVAESCAGLHAAHEMTDAEGTVQHVVHRDVSPQNLFVTYDGQVKVLDFGVAKAADRIARTEVGQLKGKFEYMSPEQCSAKPIDRRSDIFALGIVLYELTTGRKLFKRESPAETVRAICDHGIVPPSRLLEDYPAALERICLRALESAPADRYPTALAMRRELLAFLRSREMPHEAGEEMSRVMNAIFADRVAEKREILRRVRSGSKVTHVPAGEIDEGVEIAQAPEPTEVGGSSTRTDVDVRATDARRSRWKPAVVAGGMIAAGAALAGSALFLRRPVASAAPATAVMTAPPPPSAAPPPAPAPVPEPSASTAAAPVTPVAPAPTPAKPKAGAHGTAKGKDSAATGPWTKWH